LTGEEKRVLNWWVCCSPKRCVKDCTTSQVSFKLGEGFVFISLCCPGSEEMSARRNNGRSHRSLRPISMIFILLFVNIAGTAAEEEAFNAEVCGLPRFECCTKTREKTVWLYYLLMPICEILFGCICRC